MKDDIQIHGCFSFEPIFRNQPLSNHGIKQWILKWYLQRLSKLEFFYIGIYFLFCSPKSVREQLLFFSEGRSGFSWFWKITQQFSTGCQKDCIGFAFLRFVIGPQNSHTLSHQSEAKLKKSSRLGHPRFPRFRQLIWFYFEFLLAL